MTVSNEPPFSPAVFFQGGSVNLLQIFIGGTAKASATDLEWKNENEIDEANYGNPEASDVYLIISWSIGKHSINSPGKHGKGFFCNYQDDSSPTSFVGMQKKLEVRRQLIWNKMYLSITQSTSPI